MARTSDSPIVAIISSDHNRLEVEKLPDGRVIISTWVSNKRLQSYFVLDEAVLNAFLESVEELLYEN